MTKVEKVKTVRDKTGVGVMEAVRFLASAEGDTEKAIDLARAVSTRMESRGTGLGNGVIASYITEDGLRGVMVELLCETDFAAKTKIFNDGARLIAQGRAIGAPEENVEKVLSSLTMALKEPVQLGRCETFDMGVNDERKHQKEEWPYVCN